MSSEIDEETKRLIRLGAEITPFINAALADGVSYIGLSNMLFVTSFALLKKKGMAKDEAARVTIDRLMEVYDVEPLPDGSMN